MQQIRALQVLRAIAACAVVFSHAHARVDLFDRGESALTPEWAAMGHAGVDLFFVLSGFLMTYLHSAEFGVPGAWKPFLIKRVVRIVPLYWSLTTIAFALLIAAPWLFTYHSAIDLPWVIANYLFVPWPVAGGDGSPVIGAGWTLNYEMHFYVMFAVAMLLPRRSGLTLLCTVFSSAVLIGIVMQPQHPWLRLLTGPLLLEFLFGVLLARIVTFPVPRLLAWSVLIAALVWFAIAGYPTTFPARVLAWGVPCALIMASVLWLGFACRGRIGRALVTIGDASYSIYLFQVFAIPGFYFVFRPLHLPADVFIVALFVASCAAGVIVWRFVERPLTAWAKGALEAGEAAPQVKSA